MLLLCELAHPQNIIEISSPPDFDSDEYFDTIGVSELRNRKVYSSSISREDFSSGVLTTSLGTNLSARAVILQTNGSIIVGGRHDRGTISDMFVARYLPDGAIDNQFGTNGFLTSTFSTNPWQDEIIHALVLQTDGKTVAVGKSDIMGGYYQFTVLRYTLLGSMDTSFNTAGYITSSFSSRTFQIPRGVALETTGKIIASGYSWSGTEFDSTIARYTTDGRLDTSYYTAGFNIASTVPGNDGFMGVTIDTQGQAIGVGNSLGANWNYTMARFLTSGSLDTSFETDGYLNIGVLASDDAAYATIQDPNVGLYYLGGVAYNGANLDFALVRVLTDGSIDTTFATNGKRVTTFGTSDDTINSLGIQTDGSVYASGYYHNAAGNKDFTLARYLTDGRLDTSFETDGVATNSATSNDDYSQGFAMQGNENLVQAGRTNNGAGLSLVIMRYQTNGALAKSGFLDLSFGTAGSLSWSFGPGTQSVPRAGTLQTDGKYIGVGWMLTSGGGYTHFGVARFKPTNGTFDTSFNTSGRAFLSISTNTSVAYAVNMATNGGILIAGNSRDGSRYGYAVMKITTDGVLDTAFNTSGQTRVDVGGAGDDYGYHGIVQTDGAFVLHGYANNLMGIMRLTSDGILDTTFRTTGKATDSSANNYLIEAALQSDGKIFSVGRGINGTLFGLLARYRTDGSFDTSFNTTGRKLSGSGAVFNAAFIQTDGKYLSYGYYSGSGYDYYGVRILTNGTLDTTFNTSGVFAYSPSGGHEYVESVRTSDSGQVIACGKFLCVRQRTDGSLDTVFAISGATNFASTYIYTLTRTLDGKFLVIDDASSVPKTLRFWP